MRCDAVASCAGAVSLFFDFQGDQGEARHWAGEREIHLLLQRQNTRSTSDKRGTTGLLRRAVPSNKRIREDLELEAGGGELLNSSKTKSERRS